MRAVRHDGSLMSNQTELKNRFLNDLSKSNVKIEDLTISTGDLIPKWTAEEKTRLEEVLSRIFEILDKRL